MRGGAAGYDPTRNVWPQVHVERVLNFPPLEESKFRHVLTQQSAGGPNGPPKYDFALEPHQVKQLLDILSVESLQLPATLPPGVHLVPDLGTLTETGVWGDGFVMADALAPLSGRRVCFVGDSNTRNMYKDVVALLATAGAAPLPSAQWYDRLVEQAGLRRKGEASFCGDTLLEGGARSAEGAHNRPHYREVRAFESAARGCRVTFHFVTRAWNDYVRDEVMGYVEREAPDVVIMGSCMWDLHRYGPDQVQSLHHYTKRLRQLAERLREMRQTGARATRFAWHTAMPAAPNSTAGFLNEAYAHHVVGQEVPEANRAAANTLVREAGVSVLDTSRIAVQSLELRAPDGVHWSPLTHRHISQAVIQMIQRMCPSSHSDT